MKEYKICLIENCGRYVRTKGLCHKHYMKQWAAGKRCVVENCNNQISSGKYCRTHRQRLKKHNSINIPEKEKTFCSMCEKEEHALGYCYTHYHYNYRRTDNGKFSKARYNAIQRGFEWNLTQQQFNDIMGDRLCYYCGDSFKTAGGSNLDRKDNNLNYTFGNVVACCWPCNDLKGHSLTHDEMTFIMSHRKHKNVFVLTEEEISLIFDRRNQNEVK